MRFDGQYRDVDARLLWEVPVDSAYLTFAPDIAFPGAPDAVAEVAGRLLSSGVGRVVLLSGREEPEAQRAERLVADLAAEHGAEWAVARCSFFMQNFEKRARQHATLSLT